jgi:hypothetical protein
MKWNWLLSEAYCLYDNISTEDKLRAIVYKGKAQKVREKEELDKEIQMVANPMKKKEKKKPDGCPGEVCYTCFELECPFLALGKGRWNDLDDDWITRRKEYEREVEGYKEEGTDEFKTRLSEQTQDCKDSVD